MSAELVSIEPVCLMSQYVRRTPVRFIPSSQLEQRHRRPSHWVSTLAPTKNICNVDTASLRCKGVVVKTPQPGKKKEHIFRSIGPGLEGA